ncbi:MAG: hypothetical protein CMM62_09360 [Rhodospirillaceae bacterium]|nr:hypothetical protein [Rhodospirillaceae bacterium]MAX61921.1 hypothetical protein [Rhodospirillaceae bacterium]MAX63257.1 hypothetical protein [Rhodospirillaceae bacterium]|tara:strand:- start:505 stop:771 length:267 start_codon:yes stop_codon:yes gene_type:complete
MPKVTLTATVTLSPLNREEWEDEGFDPDDYADGHGGAVDAVTPEILASSLNDLPPVSWQHFLEFLLFEDDTACGKVTNVTFAVDKTGG